MALDRASIEAMIQACYDAEREVLTGKTVQFNGRAVSMESLKEIRAARQEYERKLETIGRRRAPQYRTARFV